MHNELPITRASDGKTELGPFAIIKKDDGTAEIAVTNMWNSVRIEDLVHVDSAEIAEELILKMKALIAEYPIDCSREAMDRRKTLLDAARAARKKAS